MTVTVTPIHPHIGAEIRGVDVSRAPHPATLEALWRAIDRHAVLVFHDQQVSDRQRPGSIFMPLHWSEAYAPSGRANPLVAKSRDLYLENFWMKNRRSIEKGKSGPTYGWVIPAAQRRKSDAADMVNDLKRQGIEVHTAKSAFKAGSVDVAAGDSLLLQRARRRADAGSRQAPEVLARGLRSEGGAVPPARLVSGSAGAI